MSDDEEQPIHIGYFHANDIIESRLQDSITAREFMMWLYMRDWKSYHEVEGRVTGIRAWHGEQEVKVSTRLIVDRIQCVRRAGKVPKTIERFLIEWRYDENELRHAELPRWLSYEQLLNRWMALGKSRPEIEAAVEARAGTIGVNLLSDTGDTDDIGAWMFCLPWVQRVENEIFPSIKAHVAPVSKKSQQDIAKLPRPKAQSPDRSEAKNYWLKWQSNPGLYENQAAYVADMLEKTSITRAATIHEWIKEWKQEQAEQIE